VHLAAWLALAPAITSFTLMNFTGASTFTSLSGVLREMRFAVPAQIAAGALGLVLWLTGLFVGGGPVR
jgi:acetyl-CoA decarbonylase/synthase complex subunit gamma